MSSEILALSLWQLSTWMVVFLLVRRARLVIREKSIGNYRKASVAAYVSLWLLILGTLLGALDGTRVTVVVLVWPLAVLFGLHSLWPGWTEGNLMLLTSCFATLVGGFSVTWSLGGFLDGWRRLPQNWVAASLIGSSALIFVLSAISGCIYNLGLFTGVGRLIE